MKKEHQFMLNLVLIISSYACAVRGEIYVCALLGIAAVVLAIASHSLNCLERRLNDLLKLSGVFALFLYMTPLATEIPLLFFSVFVNCTTAILWSESSFKAIRHGLHFLLGSLPIMALGALVLGDGSLTLVCMLYLPFLSQCFDRYRVVLPHTRKELCGIPARTVIK